MNITIPAGERTGLMDLVVYPHRLSPDSAYFIPLRIDKFTEYELNPEKSDVLYRVMIKNYYASQKTPTTYNLRGKHDEISIMIQKRVFPIDKSTVRIAAGNISIDPEATADFINKASILLWVGDNNQVVIYPYKTPEEGGVTVTQIADDDPDYDPDYPNIFRIDDDGYNTYKTFLLHYKYVYQGVTHTMKEELRLEFNKTNEFF
jgi:hypothetical protein